MNAAAATASRSRARASGSAQAAASLATPPVARVRWDRLGRAAMLCVLAALLYLYVSAGVRMLSTWRQSRRDSAQVAALEREHRALVSEH